MGIVCTWGEGRGEREKEKDPQMDLSSLWWKRAENRPLERPAFSVQGLTLPDWGCLFGSNWKEGLDLLFPGREERRDAGGREHERIHTQWTESRPPHTSSGSRRSVSRPFTESSRGCCQFTNHLPTGYRVWRPGAFFAGLFSGGRGRG